jgi:hypothetical protein
MIAHVWQDSRFGQIYKLLSTLYELPRFQSMFRIRYQSLIITKSLIISQNIHFLPERWRRSKVNSACRRINLSFNAALRRATLVSGKVFSIKKAFPLPFLVTVWQTLLTMRLIWEWCLIYILCGKPSDSVLWFASPIMWDKYNLTKTAI